MIIKRITVDERGLATGLFNKYRIFYKQPSDLPLAEQFLKERLENNESVIFVATISNKDSSVPAGFTQLYPILSSALATKNWLINDLYVETDYRKQGIGEALIKTAMNFAKSEDSIFVRLETAFDNYAAQRLYESIGFKKQEPNKDFFAYQITLI